jgi:hypothetical protein
MHWIVCPLFLLFRMVVHIICKVVELSDSRWTSEKRHVTFGADDAHSIQGILEASILSERNILLPI